MIGVIRFPGSNCDEDTRYSLEQLGADVKFVWHGETSLEGVDAVVLPGGFSYGDYLRSGAIASHSPIMSAVRNFADDGGPVLGICNGFQVLTEAGLLPGALARNASPHFVCRSVAVRVERNDLAFTANFAVGQVLNLPVAHAEGSYFADEGTLAALEARGGVVLRYCDDDGSLEGGSASRSNPNGSVGNIAGIVNERGNVLGMMPHPERAVEQLLGGSDGKPLLAALVDYVASGRAAPDRRAAEA